MKRYLSFIAVSALLTVSCAKEVLNGSAIGGDLVETVLHVGMESKTTLTDSGAVLWDEGDKLDVLDGTGNRYTFTAQGSGASVDFVGDAPEGASMEGWVAYFASNSGLSYDGTSLFAPVLHDVTASSTKIFGRMAGVVGSGNMVVMKQVGGLLSFELTTSDITSVMLVGNNGEHLAGKFNVTFPEGVPVTATPAFDNNNRQEQYSSVLMTPAEGTFAPGKYYLPVPVTTFSEGITLRFTRASDALYSEKVGSSALTVTRAGIKPLGVVDANLQWSRQVHFSVFDYKDSAKGAVWPFTEASSAYTTANERKEYVTVKEGLSFYISLSDVSSAWGAVGSNCQGLKFGKSADDYLELPVVPGHGLKKIVLTSGSAKNAVTLSIENAATSEIVSGSSWTNSTGRGAVKVWDINDETGAAFRIRHDDTKYCCIQKLDLYYTDLSSDEPEVTSVTTTAKACEFVSAKGAEGTAVIEGSMIAKGFSSDAFACGFQYRPYGTTEWTNVNADASALSFSATLAGLTDYERYEYRAWAKLAAGGEKVYGDVCTFTVSDKNGGVRVNYTFANKSTPSDESYNAKYVTGGYLNSTKSPVVATTPKSFGLPSDKDQILSFTVGNLASAGYCYRSAGTPKNYYGLCISYNLAENAYIMLPAVSGWSLYGLKPVFYDNGTTYNISSSVDPSTLVGDGAYLESTATTSKYGGSYCSLTGLGETPITGDVYICGTSKAVTIFSLELRYQVNP